VLVMAKTCASTGCRSSIPNETPPTVLLAEPSEAELASAAVLLSTPHQSQSNPNQRLETTPYLEQLQ